MHSSYSSWLVSLSIGVAILVSFTSLRLASRVAESKAPAGRIWLMLGAISMGVGIWAMHFIGMLAFTLPIQLHYSIAITFASLGAAVVTSGFAIKIASSRRLGLARHIVCSLVMGLGIVTMHYTGMRAILIYPAITYTASIVAASVGVAVTASFAALWLTFRLRGGTHRLIWAARLGAAVIMGLAIAGMHYTAMAAAEFQAGAYCRGGVALDNQWLAISVAIAALALLTITLITGIFDTNLAARARLHSKRLHDANFLLAYQASHDTITNLPGRALFIDKLQRAIDESLKLPDASPFLAVMLVDLDRFKTINDSLGHGVGDVILRKVSARLSNMFVGKDVVARLGGDEFLVLTHVPDTRSVIQIAQKIVELLRRPYHVESGELHLAASIGITTYPFDESSPDVLISHADEAMYEIKHDGGNGYGFFMPGTTVFTPDRLQLENDLRRAPGRGELELHYQPQVEISTGRIVGLEALARWHHPQRGWIPPLDFIPLAEASDLIVLIGQWILEEACRQGRVWLDEGIADVRIAINLSARQFRQPDLVDVILKTVSRHGLQPCHIVIELTEAVVMTHVDRSAEILEELHRSGFEVAVDDFGTGYSSLSYLKRLPVGKLKIDRSFIIDLGQNAKSDSIVRAVILLAHGLGMSVVAEGVETATQLAGLREFECDQYQGYLCSRPKNAADIAPLLHRAPQAADASLREDWLLELTG